MYKFQEKIHKFRFGVFPHLTLAKQFEPLDEGHLRDALFKRIEDFPCTGPTYCDDRRVLFSKGSHFSSAKGLLAPDLQAYPCAVISRI